jgi:RNA polymerase sigma-32 factor
VLPPEEQIRLAKKYRHHGDLDAAYQLVTSNLKLVVKIANGYRWAASSRLDLVQEGNIGLMRAVQKFNPYRGVKLSTYASFWIRAYIIRYLVQNSRLVRMGSTRVQRRLFFNLRREKARLLAMGYDVGPKLLAERLQATEAEVVEMDRRLDLEEISIDAPMRAGEERSLGDLLPGPEIPADERMAEDELRQRFRQTLDQFSATLGGREKLIFERRVIADEPLTLQQVGDAYGISRERARQIELKVTRRLKTYVKAEMAEVAMPPQVASVRPSA